MLREQGRQIFPGDGELHSIEDEIMDRGRRRMIEALAIADRVRFVGKLEKGR